MILLMAVCFLCLRLGWLPRWLREIPLFTAASTLPMQRILLLFLLRLVFVSAMVLLGWTSLAAYDVVVGPWDLLLNFSGVLLAATLPSVAGLGPSQLAMVELFGAFADRETLFAAAMTYYLGLLLLRALIGLLFAREYTELAMALARGSGEPEPSSDN